MGLLECSLDQVVSIGNSALRGAKLALREQNDLEIQEIRNLTKHVELATIPDFQDSFADAMFFPESS